MRNTKFRGEAPLQQSVGSGWEGFQEGPGDKCTVLLLSRVGFTSV